MGYRRGRVAYTLLELAKYFGQDAGSGRVLIRQKIGQSDLAAMTGVVRETVNRILNDWKRRRVVSRLSGYYCLENSAILQKEADTLDGACGARLSRVRLADMSEKPDADGLTLAHSQASGFRYGLYGM